MSPKFCTYDITNLVLMYCFTNGISVSPLKLQKLLYYLQAWYLVYFNGDLLFDEKPQAWVNGPVYPSVFNRFRNIGIYDELTPENTNLKMSCDSNQNLINFVNQLGLDQRQQEFVNFILLNYGKLNHDRLVFMTHSELPWSEKREGLSPFMPSNNELSFDTMRSYYLNRLQKNRSNRNAGV